METTASLIHLYQTAEIEIIYKSKIKASARREITTTLNLFGNTGMQEHRNYLKN